jgi:23S rRNA (guanosine2251-2'-O)-methyltransferase
MSRNKFPPKPKYDPDTGPVYLYGIHTVRSALDNPKRGKKALLLTPNARIRLEEMGPLGKVPVTETNPKELDRLLGGEAVHQGVALEVDPVSRFGLDDLRAPRLVVVLDQVTDPHNVGAILRTACAFGADAVVTTHRYAPRETGVLAKAASGALDLVKLVRVVNLARALDRLKEEGFWSCGLDESAPTPLSALDLGARAVLVLGSEGGGLRRLVRERCDHLARLPTRPEMPSLNVSNAAAVALYELTSRSTPQPT